MERGCLKRAASFTFFLINEKTFYGIILLFFKKYLYSEQRISLLILKTYFMRTLLRVIVDVTAGNKAVADGSLAQIIKSTMDKLKPEAAYFHTVDGSRSCFMVFDLKDPSEIPGIAEPFFTGFNAIVEF